MTAMHYTDEQWNLIQRLGEQAGVSAEAIRKWRVRGSVPGKWQTLLIAASKGKLKVLDFLQREEAA